MVGRSFRAASLTLGCTVLQMIPVPVLVIVGLVVLGLAAAGFYTHDRLVRRFAWGGALWLALTLGYLRSGDLPVLLNRLPTDPVARALVQVYDTVWWISLAWLTVAGINVLLWCWLFPRASHAGGRKLVADVISALVYVATIFAIMSFAFDYEINALLATSGVVAIVIGLALQSSLGEIVSGLFMSVEAPYHAGDWITLDDTVEGQVIETNWRATRIKTRSGDIRIVPNSVIAHAQIINHYFPNQQHHAWVDVTVDARTPPQRVVAVLLAAALGTKCVRHDPAPRAMVRTLGQTAIDYRVEFVIDDFAEAPAARSDVASRIWLHLSWAGIRMDGPPLASPGNAESEAERTAALQKALARISLFATLSFDESGAIAAGLRTHKVMAGTPLVNAGESGDSMFLISEGVLIVKTRTESGEENEVSRLGPGDYFGEMSLLTGAPRSANVVALTDGWVHELAKDDLAPLMAARPVLAHELGQVLAARRRTLAEAGRAEHRSDESEESYAERISAWITTFFRSAA
jgi:small-conductance mechanosensitive channel/CRP-like cAMP-binding protein